MRFAILTVAIFTGGAFASVSWDWESGTTEGWYWWDEASLPVNIAIEEGFSSQYSLEISGQEHFMITFDAFSDNLIPLTGYIADDIDFIEDQYLSVDVDMEYIFGISFIIYGMDYKTGWINDNYIYPGGTKEELSNGWFRYQVDFAGLLSGNNFTDNPEGYPFILLSFAQSNFSEDPDIQIDNLKIVPEPCSVALLTFGVLLLRRCG